MWQYAPGKQPKSQPQVIPLNQSSFSELPLPKNLLENLESLGYQSMTPIQAQSLPGILQGRDVIAQAKTGSGKTAAFGLGLLSRLKVEQFAVQTLVLCPTRELADQVAESIRSLGRRIHNIKVLTLCGGQPMGPQIGSLEHGAHIIVGTPGRVLDHLQKQRLQLDQVATLVLDEADRMLDMGFQKDLDAIFEYMPQAKQTLLFSATYPEGIQQIVGQLLQNPLRISVDTEHQSVSIEEHFYAAESEPERWRATSALLFSYQPLSAMVFVNTKRAVQSLTDSLNQQGLVVDCLHGDMEQKHRDQTLIRFANNSLSVLVATDVAARGLDIPSVDLVINAEPARDPEVHVHRVGRTGRAGKTGQAFTLVNAREQQKLEQLRGRAISLEALPDMRALEQSAEPYRPPMVTLQIDGGKKNKLRPGDILGALTAGGALTAEQVGKIKITALKAFVAVERSEARRALKLINQNAMKGRQFRARIL